MPTSSPKSASASLPDQCHFLLDLWRRTTWLGWVFAINFVPAIIIDRIVRTWATLRSIQLITLTNMAIKPSRQQQTFSLTAYNTQHSDQSESIMVHHVRSLLLVVVFGAAAMAASGEHAMPPLPEYQLDFPPLPAPADIPPPAPCLNSISVCASVYLDNSTLAPCCAAVKKLYNSDPKCVCDAVGQTQQIAKQYGLNGTFDGLEMFRQCDMPTDSCDPGKPGSQKIGNSASSWMSIGASQIMLLLPLFVML